jgi:hypothetical protein
MYHMWTRNWSFVEAILLPTLVAVWEKSQARRKLTAKLCNPFPNAGYEGEGTDQAKRRPKGL